MLFLIILFNFVFTTIHLNTLEIKYKWMNGKAVIAINNQNIGPVLRTTIGDTLKINVINSLFDGGITVHWHGMHLHGVPFMDGTPAVTQCIIGTGTNMTYEFITDRIGTYWYHGHVETQRNDAFFGALIVEDVINPIKYDREIIIILSDFYSDYENKQILMLKSHPFMWVGPPQYILANGVNRYNISVYYGLTYLIRFICATADSYINITIPNHNMTIVEVEGTYVEPIDTSHLWINAGERYTVLLRADNPGCYNINMSSMNDIPVKSSMGLLYNNVNCTNGKFISGIAVKKFDTDLLKNKFPVLLPAPNKKLTILFGDNHDHGGKTYTLNNISFGFPTMPILLSYYQKSYTNNDMTQIIHVNMGDVIDITFVNYLEQHPFHIHGHSFYVLGANHNTINPVRRDTITIPKNSTVTIRLIFNNPGVWLAHCHISWHVIMGMSLIFAYPPETIPVPPPDFMICGKPVFPPVNYVSVSTYLLIMVVVIGIALLTYFVLYIFKNKKPNEEKFSLV